MAGHSKWANIQHRKKAQDAKRGKIFTRLIREITVAARMHGSDVSTNPRLRLAVEKALAANMSRDTIDRACLKGAGELEGQSYEEICYEGYGPGGCAVLVETLTDNRNRTVADVRHCFSKHGGNLGTEGSVHYLFEKQGQFLFEPGTEEESVFELALEHGASDVACSDDGVIEVLIDPELFLDLNHAFLAAGLQAESAEVVMLPSTRVELALEQAQSVLKLLDRLEECDDVQNVYHNGEIPSEAYTD